MKKNMFQIKLVISLFCIITLLTANFPADKYSNDPLKETSKNIKNSFYQPDITQNKNENYAGNTGYDDHWFYISDDLPGYLIGTTPICHSANGNLYTAERDISINALGFNIEIIRSYNSHNSVFSSGFGFGWTFNYNRYLIDKSDYVILVDGDGSFYNFTHDGGGIYSSPSGIHSRLNRNPDTTYTLWSNNGGKYNFNSEGILLNTTDKNGNSLNLIYYGEKLVNITDDSGLWINFSYNIEDRIEKCRCSLGRTITYGYDEWGNLVSVTDAMGNETRYSYNEINYIDSIIIRDTDWYEINYNENTGPIIDLWAVENIYKFTYGDYGKTSLNPLRVYLINYKNEWTNFTDAGGFQTCVQHNEFGNPTNITNPLGHVSRRIWDDDMNVIIYTDENLNTWTYNYDSYGNMVNETDPLDNTIEYDWENIDTDTRYISLLRNITNKLGYETKYEYDSNGNLITITDARGNISSRDYDSHGNIITYTDFRNYQTNYSYDYHGNMVNIIDVFGSITEIGYDAAGRLINITDANGHTTYYKYDYNDKLVKITDELGNETIFNYNAKGEITRVIDSNGHETDYNNNVLGKVDEVTDALDQKTFYRYYRPGCLKKEIDANDHATSYSYSMPRRLTSFTDALGNRENYTYDCVGNLISITDKNGHITSYTYDPLNRLVKIKDPLNNNVSYEYDSVGNRISTTNRNNQTTHYEYDGLNRLIKITDAVGNETIYEYDENSNLILIEDANGHTTNYTYDPLNRITKVNWENIAIDTYSYDAVGNIVNVTDSNLYSTRYEYDSLNRLIKVTDAVGNTSSYTYDSVGNRLSSTDRNGEITQYEYDSLNRLVTVTDAVGNTTTYTYDGIGNRLTATDRNGEITQYEYDPLNRLIKTTDALNGETTFEYDAVGNIINITDPNLHITRYEYDSLNRLVTITDAVGNSSSYNYDANGNIVNIIDKKEREKQYEYDPLNRLIRFIDVSGNETNYSYDTVGNLINITDANEHSTNYEYDSLNRLITITDALGYETDYEYDGVGNRINITNEEGFTTSYSYDSLNRLVVINDALGNNINYTYDPVGNLLRTSDRNSYNITYIYDDINRLIKTTDALNWETIYRYDANGNIVNVTDSNLHSTNYEYDSLNRLITLTNPIGNIWSYSYDKVGNVNKTIDANGNITTYTYDQLNRLISKTYGYSINGVDYDYDEIGNIVKIIHNDGIGDITYYQYDDLNRLISIKVDYGGSFNKTINYTYDPVGNVDSMKYPDGHQIFYTYDAVNQQISSMEINPPSPLLLTLYKYDGTGRITQIDYPNGFYELYKYNEVGRLTNLETYNKTGITYWNYSYAYDNNGNILNILEAFTNTIISNDYDALNRLLNSTRVSSSPFISNYNIQYTYDGVGNRISETYNGIPSLYSYDNADRMLSKGTNTYDYDNNGNLIEKSEGLDITNYSYDYENRLTAVELPNGDNVSYQYSPNGNIIQRNISSGAKATDIEYCTYAPNPVKNIFRSIPTEFNMVSFAAISKPTSLFETSDDIGTPISTISYDPTNEPVSITMLTSGIPDPYVYLTDHQGSVTNILDMIGFEQVFYTYDPFGETTEAWGSFPDNPLNFMGIEYESEIGLYTPKSDYPGFINMKIDLDIDTCIIECTTTSSDPDLPGYLIGTTPISYNDEGWAFDPETARSEILFYDPDSGRYNSPNLEYLYSTQKGLRTLNPSKEMSLKTDFEVGGEYGEFHTSCSYGGGGGGGGSSYTFQDNNPFLDPVPHFDLISSDFFGPGSDPFDNGVPADYFFFGPGSDPFDGIIYSKGPYDLDPESWVESFFDVYIPLGFFGPGSDPFDGIIYSKSAIELDPESWVESFFDVYLSSGFFGPGSDPFDNGVPADFFGPGSDPFDGIISNKNPYDLDPDVWIESFFDVYFDFEGEYRATFSLDTPLNGEKPEEKLDGKKPVDKPEVEILPIDPNDLDLPPLEPEKDPPDFEDPFLVGPSDLYVWEGGKSSDYEPSDAGLVMYWDTPVIPRPSPPSGGCKCICNARLTSSGGVFTGSISGRCEPIGNYECSVKSIESALIVDYDGKTESARGTSGSISITIPNAGSYKNLKGSLWGRVTCNDGSTCRDEDYYP